MHYWSLIRETYGLFGAWERNWSEPSKDQIDSEMDEPRTVKEVQWLVGMMASTG